MMRCNWQIVHVKSHVEGAICYSTGRTVRMYVHCFNLVLFTCFVHAGASDNEVRQEGMSPPTTVPVNVRGQPPQAMEFPPWNTGYGMQ